MTRLPSAAELRAGEKVNSKDDFFRMPEEYQRLVKKQLMKHTEGEYSGADDYALIFYPMAPNSYEKAVCFERGIEELNHFDLGAAVLSDIGVDMSYLVHTSLHERDLYGTEGVKEIGSWLERGLFSYLGEDAVMAHLVEMRQSSYLPVGEMLESVIKDEKVHVAHGFRIVREIAKTEEGRKQIENALERWWPLTLDLFGVSESANSASYVHWGLRQKSNEEARQEFAAYARKKLEALDVKVPGDKANRKFL